MTALRRLRRFLAADDPGYPAGLFADHRARFEQTWALVRVFYALHLFWLSQAFKNWRDWLEMDHAVPIWPLSWLGGFPFPQQASTAVVFFAVSVIAATVAPHRRINRVLVCASWLLYGALDNSFGKIDHGFHAWIYVSFVLVLWPDGPVEEVRRSRSLRQSSLFVFATAQAVVLACYSVSGFWKLRQGIIQALDSEIGWMHPRAMAYLTANRLQQTATDSVFGPLVIELDLLGGLMSYAGLYLEIFALMAIFRPPLLRFWGFLIVGLHLGTTLVLQVSFFSNVLLVGALFVAAPGARGSVKPLDLIIQMPLIQGAIRLGRLFVRWARGPKAAPNRNT